MAKCRLDIEKDIAQTAHDMLNEKQSYTERISKDRRAAMLNQHGMKNFNKVRSKLQDINNRFGEEVINIMMSDNVNDLPHRLLFLPSEGLVERYYEAYLEDVYQKEAAEVEAGGKLPNKEYMFFQKSGELTIPDLPSDTAAKLREMKKAFGNDVVVVFDSELDANGAILGKNSSRYKKLEQEGIVSSGNPVVVLNPTRIQKDTVYHEYAHIYLDLIEDSARFNTLMDTLRDTELWNEVKNNYPELNEKDLQKEVAATALGLQGAYEFDERTKGRIQRFWDWLLNRISRLLGMSTESLQQNATVKGVFEHMSTNDYSNSVPSAPEVTQLSKKRKSVPQTIKEHSAKITLDDSYNEDGSQNHDYYFTTESGKKIKIPKSVTEVIDPPSQYDDMAIDIATDQLVNEGMITDPNNLTSEEESLINVRVSKIKNEWNNKAKVGTFLHERAERIINSQKQLQDPDPELFSEEGIKALTKFDKFIENIKDRTRRKSNPTVLMSEVRLYDAFNRVAGTIDLLEYNPKTGQINVYDFKSTNKDYYRSKAKQEKVAKQMSAYATMIKNIFGYEISDMVALPIQYETNEEGRVSGIKDLDSSIKYSNEPGINVKTLPNFYELREETINAGIKENPNAEQKVKEEIFKDLKENLNKTKRTLIRRLDSIPNIPVQKAKTPASKYIANLRSDIESIVDKIDRIRKEEDLISILDFFQEKMASISRKFETNYYDKLAADESIEDMFKIIQYDLNDINVTRTLEQLEHFIREDKISLIDEEGNYHVTGVSSGNFFQILENARIYESKLQDLIIGEIAKIGAERTHYGERKYKLKYQKEFREQNPSGTREQRNEYVRRRMKENEKEIFDVKVREIKKRLINTPQDIAGAKGWVYDPKIVGNNAYLEMALSMLDEQDQNNQIEFTEIQKEVFPIFERYFKDRGFVGKSIDTENLYNEFIARDEKGNKTEFLLGEYQAQVYVDWLEARNSNAKKKEWYKKYLEETAEGKKIKDKYKSKKFEKLSQDKAWKEAYDKFIELTKAADDMLMYPDRLERKFFGATFVMLPAMMKTTTERVFDGQHKDWIDKAKRSVKDAFTRKVDDEAYGGKGLTEEEFEDPYAENIGVKLDSESRQLKEVPVFYRRKFGSTREEHLKEQSYDLARLFLGNYSMALNYKNKSKIANTLKMLVYVAQQPEHKTLENKVGKKLRVSYEAMKKGEQSIEDYALKIDNEKSNWYTLLEEVIDDRLFGIKDKYAATGGIDLNKATQNLLRYTGAAGMWLNHIAATANVGTGTMRRFVEASGGRFFNMSDLKTGQARYWADAPNILNDVGRLGKTSKTGLLGELFDINHQFKGVPEKVNLNTKLKQALGGGASANFLQNGGEHFLQHWLMYTMLSRYKVKNAKGEYINEEGTVVDAKDAMSLDNAFDIKMKVKRDGKVIEINKDEKEPSDTIMKTPYLRLKDNVKQIDGFAIDDISKLSEDDLQNTVFLDIQNKIKELSFNLDGQYDDKLNSRLQRTWWGKLVMIFRKWLFRGINDRFENLSNVNMAYEDMTEEDIRYSNILEEDIEGYYTSTLRFLGRVFSDYESFGMNLKARYNSLSDMEKSNIKKTMMEGASIVSLLLLSKLFFAALAEGADDDDKTKYYYAALISRRIYTELRFYTSIPEALKILKSPMASISVANDVIQFGNYIISQEEYARGDREGQWKGWKKLEDLTPAYKQFRRSPQEYYEFLTSNWGAY